MKNPKNSSLYIENYVFYENGVFICQNNGAHIVEGWLIQVQSSSFSHVTG